MIVPGAQLGVTDFVLVSGVPANPDSITAVLYRWVAGVRSASGATVTVTAVGSGEYRFTWTNDGGWTRTDDLELVALPVKSGVTYPATIWRSHGHVDAIMRGTDAANTIAPANTTIADIYALLQLTDADVSTMATDTRDAILNRVLAGNHTTAGTVGLLLQFLDALISSGATPAQVLTQITAGLDAISQTALRRFATVDTSETTASAGSVAQLAQGAGGGGGGTDWNDVERSQIRYRLGLNGTAVAPTDPVPDPIVVTPGTGETTTAYLTCLTAALAAEAGVTVSQELVATGPGDAGIAYSGAAARTFTSSGVGVVEMPSVKGATYRFWRGQQTGGIVVTIPVAAGSTFELPSLIGR